MKKLFALLLVVLMCFGTVFANGESEAPAEEGPVTITYYTWQDAAHKPLIDAFNASQDDIFVDAHILASADYETKLTTLLAGGAEMDCFMEKRQVDMYGQYDNGYIEPLDKFYEKTGADMSAVNAYKAQVYYDGHIIALPWRAGSYYTYYNKKLFEAAGIPTPDYYVERGEWTWDKFQEVALALHEFDSKNESCIFIWGSLANFMESQAQKPMVNLDGEIDMSGDFFKQLEMRKQLEDAGALTKLINLKVTKTHYSKVFYDGHCPMLLIGEWFPGQMTTGDRDGLLTGFTKADYGITRLPCNQKDYVTQGASTNNHIVAYSKHKDAAFTFIQWMSSPEAAKIAAGMGVLPAVVTDDVKAVLAENLPDQKSLDYLTEDRTIYTANFTPYGSRVESMIDQFQEEYLTGKITKADAPAKFEANLKNIIETTY